MANSEFLRSEVSRGWGMLNDPFSIIRDKIQKPRNNRNSAKHLDSRIPPVHSSDSAPTNTEINKNTGETLMYEYNTNAYSWKLYPYNLLYWTVSVINVWEISKHYYRNPMVLMESSIRWTTTTIIDVFSITETLYIGRKKFEIYI